MCSLTGCPIVARGTVFAQSGGWKRQHLSSDSRKHKPPLCLHQSHCGWRAANLNASRLYVHEEHFSVWVGSHAGPRRRTSCPRQKCANKLGVISSGISVQLLLNYRKCFHVTEYTSEDDAFKAAKNYQQHLPIRCDAMQVAEMESRLADLREGGEREREIL